MTKDERVIVVTELLARIPYGVKVEHKESGFRGKVHKIVCYQKYDGNTICDYLLDIDFFNEGKGRDIDEFVLHLRPMSDMTESEMQELDIIWQYGEKHEAVDWLNEHHFDYRGLIEKGLAVTALPNEYPEITASEK